MRKFLISKLTRERLAPFIKKHRSSAYTLDVGCANSPYSALFSSRVGFDILPGKGVDVVGDVHNLPFPDATFEQVLCTEVFEHLHTPEQAIREINRVLKPGGKLILTTRFIFPIHDAPEDYFRYTKYGLKYLFREWDILSIEEETSTIDTVSVLIQRIAFQTDMRGGKLTRAIFLLLARVIRFLRFFVKKEYGRRSKVGVYEEENIMTSGYYMVARKKT